MIDNFKENINEVNEQTQNYLKSSVSYYKLKAFKFLMKSITSMAQLLIIGFILVIATLFISLAISAGIGALLDNMFLGFLIVGAFYILVAVIVYLKRGSLERKILEEFSQDFFDELDD